MVEPGQPTEVPGSSAPTVSGSRRDSPDGAGSAVKPRTTDKAYAARLDRRDERSGGMNTEIRTTMTAAGLGRPTGRPIGGDAIIRPTYSLSWAPS